MLPAIKIENLSKQYRLGTVGTGTLSHDLKRWWVTNIRGKEDPYLKIGEANDRAHKGSSDYVWALKDINLEVAQGEVLGIIGKNGAGKSTLLKILSKVTRPSTGTIKYRGRIASLLEVGTGFHSEMTGRENIYMNGAIMGMTKAEITRKFDEIIDFAGIERYIDTPVKRYSSGMTVRLGFAIAAHLEPEILVVDEVLAVGDADFQKKAIGKMQDVSRSDGRTVLFVSHNMGSVKSLCQSCILLTNGNLTEKGNSDEIIKKYVMDFKPDPSVINNRSNHIEIISWSINSGKIDLFIDESFNLSLSLQIHDEFNLDNEIIIVITIKDIYNNIIILTNNLLENHKIIHKNKTIDIDIDFDNLMIRPDKYLLGVQVWLNNDLQYDETLGTFEIHATKYFPMDYLPINFPAINLKRTNWNISNYDKKSNK